METKQKNTTAGMKTGGFSVWAGCLDCIHQVSGPGDADTEQSECAIPASGEKSSRRRRRCWCMFCRWVKSMTHSHKLLTLPHCEEQSSCFFYHQGSFRLWLRNWADESSNSLLYAKNILGIRRVQVNNSGLSLQEAYTSCSHRHKATIKSR